jgi:hypothetical protein
MRHLILMAVLGSALMLSGCSDLVSLNPVAPEGDSKFDPALAGAWQGSDALYVIQQDDSGYDVVYIGKKFTKQFHGVLFQAGDAMLLDLVTEDQDPFQIPVHVVARVWPAAANLSWAFLDSDWLRQQAGTLNPSQQLGERTLLTATGAAVRGFVTKYAADERAHGKPEVLAKVQ